MGLGSGVFDCTVTVSVLEARTFLSLSRLAAARISVAALLPSSVGSKVRFFEFNCTVNSVNCVSVYRTTSDSLTSNAWKGIVDWTARRGQSSSAVADQWAHSHSRKVAGFCDRAEIWIAQSYPNSPELPIRIDDLRLVCQRVVLAADSL